MQRSTDCILTTHMGSLPRPDMLADLLVAQAEGKPVDAARIPARVPNYKERMEHPHQSVPIAKSPRAS